MRIAELPAGERPRERLAALGAGALADRELLAVLLGTGGGGFGAHQLAEQLLVRFGSLIDTRLSGLFEQQQRLHEAGLA